MKVKVKTKTKVEAVTDAVRDRALLDVQTEFMRLTHAVDEAKKGGSVTRLAAVGTILSAAYITIDSWRPASPPDLRK